MASCTDRVELDGAPPLYSYLCGVRSLWAPPAPGSKYHRELMAAVTPVFCLPLPSWGAQDCSSVRIALSMPHTGYSLVLGTLTLPISYVPTHFFPGKPPLTRSTLCTLLGRKYCKHANKYTEENNKYPHIPMDSLKNILHICFRPSGNST